MAVLNDFRLKLGEDEYLPIMIGGMGVDISTADLALEACRLGGIGHISDAMTPFVSDRKFKTHFTKTKSGRYKFNRDNQDKTQIKFNLEELYNATLKVVSAAVKSDYARTRPGERDAKARLSLGRARTKCSGRPSWPPTNN